MAYLALFPPVTNYFTTRGTFLEQQECCELPRYSELGILDGPLVPSECACPPHLHRLSPNAKCAIGAKDTTISMIQVHADLGALPNQIADGIDRRHSEARNGSRELSGWGAPRGSTLPQPMESPFPG